MQRDPVGQVLFIEICKKLRDLKWIVDEQDLHKNGAITEAVFKLPERIVNQMKDSELDKKIAAIRYEGERESFERNEMEGITLEFFRKPLESIRLENTVEEVKAFRVKDHEKSNGSISFFIDQVFAENEVQEWMDELFGLLQSEMTEIYGEYTKEIPIVLLPSRLQELPLHE
ncbi:hypothetical protein [Jeotgalibacillus soli]|uniref:Uncharacterized protein n=1 Tax=Jeotgalibacillus soli TaxID=889306 RepID=A0A0C2W103_9BACL|nr:hypothetical protein [Jeotgalibacillus soli]KIL49833.1 hypothetical protein KP78_13010 [Jeotgalibacillus soli]